MNVNSIIAVFGGIRPTARALGIGNPSIVQGWIKRGRIPARHIRHIVETAAARGESISLERLFELKPIRMKLATDRPPKGFAKARRNCIK